jgi:hypothetical protein
MKKVELLVKVIEKYEIEVNELAIKDNIPHLGATMSRAPLERSLS